MGAWTATARRRALYSDWTRPLWWVLAWPVGLYLYLQFVVARATSTLEVHRSSHEGAAVYVN